MSGAGGAFGGSRGLRPVPPEKGVFPLDHFGECKLVKEKYVQCLKASGGQSERCREIAKEYLECRMERNLMAQQDLQELGFKKEKQNVHNVVVEDSIQDQRKEATGFVAGIRKKK